MCEANKRSTKRKNLAEQEQAIQNKRRPTRPKCQEKLCLVCLETKGKSGNMFACRKCYDKWQRAKTRPFETDDQIRALVNSREQLEQNPWFQCPGNHIQLWPFYTDLNSFGK